MAVNPQELRIGNWINKFCRPIQILPMDLVYLYGENNTEFAENYEPIKLSPEILEKAGFEFVPEVGGFLDKNHIIFECGESGDFWWEFHPFCTNDEQCQLEVRHLHHLQNINYYFTNQELSINLNQEI